MYLQYLAELGLVVLGCLWPFLAVLGCTWLDLAVLGFTWLYLAERGYTWLYLAEPGCTWSVLKGFKDVWNNQTYMSTDWMDGISQDRSISRSPDGDNKEFLPHNSNPLVQSLPPQLHREALQGLVRLAALAISPLPL